jgi:hypothetical protein
MRLRFPGRSFTATVSLPLPPVGERLGQAQLPHSLRHRPELLRQILAGRPVHGEVGHDREAAQVQPGAGVVHPNQDAASDS